MSDQTSREHSPTWHRLLAFDEIGVVIVNREGGVSANRDADVDAVNLRRLTAREAEDADL